MNPLKLIITNKVRLTYKYGESIAALMPKLQQWIVADKKIGIDTKVVYVEDIASTQAIGVKAIKNNSESEYKRIVDELYKKYIPAYIVLLGAQDVVPFQSLSNTANDEDIHVPSDLPYACDTPYSKNVQNFIGPSRVVGRVPDLPGKQADTSYLATLIDNIIQHKPYPIDEYHKYFAITAKVWYKSTEISLQNIFGDSSKLISSPKGHKKEKLIEYRKKQLAPMVHFFNCHGSSPDIQYYGEQGKNFPIAIRSASLTSNIRPGTVIAAECCFGAELIDAAKYELPICSIANNYLQHGAIAFVGSSTISYGPADTNSLADYITQFFIISILHGASSGRAMLEARQKFLSESGPDLDPIELKTLAQFYLLGDPSIQPAESEEAETKTKSLGNMVTNNRLRLISKGNGLAASLGKSVKLSKKEPVIHRKEINTILADTGFTAKNKSDVFKVVSPKNAQMGMQKKLAGTALKYHTYVKEKILPTGRRKYDVLVVKENENQVLGYRTYYSK